MAEQNQLLHQQAPWGKLCQGRAQGTPCRMTYKPAKGHTEDKWPLSMLACAAPPDLTTISLFR